jgi:serine/threonine protein kinase
MNRYFPQLVANALVQGSAELAVDCYKIAQQMPSTNTSEAMNLSGITILDVCAKSQNALILYGNDGLIPIALKRLSRDSTEVERLKHLAELKISHPSIIKFVNFDNWAFIKMPRVISTLQELKPLDDTRQDALFCHISSALLHLHSRGVAHMDVKPENIGLDNNGLFVLLDLGSAANFDEQTDVTDLFVPTDFVVSRGSCKAAAEIDKWMFVMTFFMKLVTHDGRTRESILNIRTALGSAHVWPKLSAFLKPDYSGPELEAKKSAEEAEISDVPA